MADEAQIEAVVMRVLANQGQQRQRDSITRADVEQMVATAIGRLRIGGSAVSGNAKSGWVVNISTIQGPRGIQGEQGIQGLPGPPGGAGGSWYLVEFCDGTFKELWSRDPV